MANGHDAPGEVWRSLFCDSQLVSHTKTSRCSVLLSPAVISCVLIGDLAVH